MVDIEGKRGYGKEIETIFRGVNCPFNNELWQSIDFYIIYFLDIPKSVYDYVVVLFSYWLIGHIPFFCILKSVLWELSLSHNVNCCHWSWL